jgi:hypothetical protein
MLGRNAFVISCLLVSACSAAGSELRGDVSTSQSESLGERQFVDARAYFTTPGDIDAWYSLTTTLKAEFDAICGDTFCEGDYSNYESLGVRCSVEQKTGHVGRCAWTFAASTEEVRPDTGAIQVQAKIWKCPLLVPRQLSARELVRVLSRSGASPLFTVLPRSNASLYDALGQCL